MAKEEVVLLPRNVQPKHYALTIGPMNTKKFEYEGAVTIDLDLLEDSSEITLNTHELELHSSRLSASGEKLEESVSPSNVSYNETRQETTFQFPQSFKAGSKAKLEIKFKGYLNNSMCGFYRSKYKGSDGTDKYLFSTQFEATDARRCFPCFDEPALKASFDVTLIAPEHLTTLSNMPITSSTVVRANADGKFEGLEKGDPKVALAQEDQEGISSVQKKVVFETTPIMSTYLLALIVGELEYVEGSTSKPLYHGKKVPVRVYTVPGLAESGRYSCEQTCKILDSYSEIFEIPYALPKMDLVAIPEFAQGAMENWGLTTYRASVLLYDEKTTSAAQKLRILEVVAHELAHQWFGNLVTMDWWSALWLNESFATWVSWYCVNQLEPSMHIWDYFVKDSLQSALGLDSVRGSHPVQLPVKDIYDIEQAFDAISYEKGASCLQMLSNFVGQEVFIKGVVKYLKKHAYSNASPVDLWSAVSDVSNQDIVKFMSTWINKIGYPVLNVASSDSKVSIRQSRFLVTGDVSREEDQVVWPIPLEATTLRGDPLKAPLMETKQTDLEVGNGGCLLNKNRAGVYRVNYEPEMLQTIGKELRKGGSLNVQDRIGLLADVFAMSKSGNADTSTFMSLLQNMKQETEFYVWLIVYEKLNEISSTWYNQGSKVQDALDSFSRGLFSEKAKELGADPKEGEHDLTRRLRVVVLRAAGMAGDQSVIETMQNKFKSYQNDPRAVPADMLAPMFAVVAAKGGHDAFKTILSVYDNAKTQDIKDVTLSALTCASDKQSWESLMELALNGHIPSQDVHVPFGGLAANIRARDYLWHIFSSEWSEILKKHGGSNPVMVRLIRLSLRGFPDRKRIEEIQDFFKDKDTKVFKQALDQSLDEDNAGANWIDRDNGNLVAWLKKNGNLS